MRRRATVFVLTLLLPCCTLIAGIDGVYQRQPEQADAAPIDAADVMGDAAPSDLCTQGFVGPLRPTTARTDPWVRKNATGEGPSSVPWITPAGATSNLADAAATATPDGGIADGGVFATETLRLGGFNAGVPLNADIRGFKVVVHRSVDGGGDVHDLYVNFVNADDGMRLSTGQESTTDPWEPAQSRAYGSDSNRWSSKDIGPLAPAEVNNVAFALSIIAGLREPADGGPPPTAIIDDVELTVHFTCRPDGG